MFQSCMRGTSFVITSRGCNKPNNAELPPLARSGIHISCHATEWRGDQGLWQVLFQWRCRGTQLHMGWGTSSGHVKCIPTGCPSCIKKDDDKNGDPDDDALPNSSESSSDDEPESDSSELVSGPAKGKQGLPLIINQYAKKPQRERESKAPRKDASHSLEMQSSPICETIRGTALLPCLI